MNYHRGLNRLFVVFCALWGIGLLIVLPVCAEHIFPEEGFANNFTLANYWRGLIWGRVGEDRQPIQTLLRDPAFLALSDEAKRIVLSRRVPEFAAISPEAQHLFIQRHMSANPGGQPFRAPVLALLFGVPAVVYALGAAVAWVMRGFRRAV